jgi:hypothetical protein
MPSPEQPEFARVELDADTVRKFEAFLRDSLVASGAVSEADNKSVEMRTTHVKISLDAKALARFTELLREGLVSSTAAHENDRLTLNALTRKIS